MNSRWRDVPWGGWGLIVAGLLALAGNLGWLAGWPPVVWITVLLCGGAALAGLGVSQPAHWWALIPAGALVGSGLAALVGGPWAGAALLGSLGTGFLAVALRSREHWWAMIPGGALLTLALVALDPGESGAGRLVLGLALTFGGVAASGSSRRWALYPAAGLVALWALSTPTLAGVSEFVWPLGLIALGAFLLRHRGQTPPGRPGGGP